jgi:hypothetical protein
MERTGFALLLAAVALAACGASADLRSATATSSIGPASPSTSEPATTPVATAALPTSSTTFPACSDVPDIEAPPEWYDDKPVYVGNEQPTSAVRAWARDRPGYQEIWIDRDHLGWIAVAFTGDVAARQTELETEFPDVGVVAVDVPTGVGELNALQRRVHRLLIEAGVSFGGLWTSPTQWVVGLAVNAADERLQSALAPVAGERICLDDTGVPVPVGPQPPAGDGWRLLDEGLVGEVYRTGIATNDDQYAVLWQGAGLTTARPPVDFATEVVVWFGAVYGSSCPIRLDDVVVDTGHDPALVHPVTVVPGGTGACTADANPHAYVVGIDRDRLPSGPFAIQLGPDDPPPGAPEERTLVDADLSVPGAVASAEDIGPDEGLIEASQQVQPEESGGFIEPGFAHPFRMDTRCGIGVLGELNGVWWATGTATVPVPPEWIELVDPGAETIVVDVLVAPGPVPTVTATGGGHSVTYEPVPLDAVPHCD